MPTYGLGHVSRCTDLSPCTIRMNPHVFVKRIEHKPFLARRTIKVGNHGSHQPKKRVARRPCEDKMLYVRKRTLIYDPLLNCPGAAPLNLKYVESVQEWCGYKFYLGPYGLDPLLLWRQVKYVWWQTGLNFCATNLSSEYRCFQKQLRSMHNCKCCLCPGKNSSITTTWNCVILAAPVVPPLRKLKQIWRIVHKQKTFSPRGFDNNKHNNNFQSATWTLLGHEHLPTHTQLWMGSHMILQA